mgnify:CR=1 FL=1
MDNLLAALSAVYPLLVAIAVGVAIRRAGLVTEQGLKEMNGLVYKMFFPVMLFANVMDSDFGGGVPWKLLGVTLGLIAVTFLALMALVPRFVPGNPQRGVMVQGIFRSNFLVFGMSIVTSLYGAERLGPAVLLSAIVIPTMNGLSVVALEVFRGGRPNVRKILLGVARNPIIIGTVLAFVCRLMGVDPLPEATRSLAKVGTPFALVIIGASFQVRQVHKYRRYLAVGVLAKLVLMPLLAVLVCLAAGLREELLVTLLAIFGGPCATASYAMAQQMDGDGDLAALMVVFTSALCVVSFFVWIFLLRSLGVA